MKPFWKVRNFSLSAVASTVLLAAVIAASPISLQGQTFTTLYNFQGYAGGADGCNPCDGGYPEGLAQGTNGLLYGPTFEGGAMDEGSVYEISTTGSSYKVLWSFEDHTTIDGYSPSAPLVLATNKLFYGTTIGTPGGGSGNGSDGVIFKMTTAGKVTVLYDFCSGAVGTCTDGLTTTSALIEASNGILYGTTSQGGTYGEGTVFKVTLGGKYTSLYSFCATRTTSDYCTDGATPYAGLVQGSDGNLYGMTSLGGANNGGTIFQITTAGKLTTIYNLCNLANCADGWNPIASLVLGADGNLYGTTSYGGSTGYGTFFTITNQGQLTTLYNFGSYSGDGVFPQAIIMGNDGNFYGVTSEGGLNDGTIFEMTPGGGETILHAFNQPVNEDGYGNGTLLMQDTNGTFYGTTPTGGNQITRGSFGTVFSLATGLAPFVQTLPLSGKIGAAVTILGTNLKGATNVSFNGTSATFKVVSSSEITTNVPTGATTGYITVIAPSGTLTSNLQFTVP